MPLIRGARLGPRLLHRHCVVPEANDAVGGHDRDDAVEALEVDAVHDAAAEDVEDHGLQRRVIGLRLKLLAREHEAGLVADLAARRPVELLERAEVADADFEKVQEVEVEHASEDEVVRPLLGRRAKRKGAAVTPVALRARRARLSTPPQRDDDAASLSTTRGPPAHHELQRLLPTGLEGL